MSGPTIWDLVERIADAVRDDARVRNGFVRACGSPPRIFRGISLRDQPGVEQAPYVAVFPLSDEIGRDRTTLRFTVRLVIGIKDDSVLEQGEEFIFLGQTSLIKELSPLVERAAQQATEAPLSIQGDFNLLDFPLLERGLTITAALPGPIGGRGAAL